MGLLDPFWGVFHMWYASCIWYRMSGCILAQDASLSKVWQRGI